MRPVVSREVAGSSPVGTALGEKAHVDVQRACNAKVRGFEAPSLHWVTRSNPLRHNRIDCSGRTPAREQSGGPAGVGRVPSANRKPGAPCGQHRESGGGRPCRRGDVPGDAGTSGNSGGSPRGDDLHPVAHRPCAPGAVTAPSLCSPTGRGVRLRLGRLGVRLPPQVLRPLTLCVAGPSFPCRPTGRAPDC